MALFLGMESLAGYAVEARRVVNVDDLTKEKLLPAYRTEFEVSAAAHPILLGEILPGALQRRVHRSGILRSNASLYWWHSVISHRWHSTKRSFMTRNWWNCA